MAGLNGWDDFIRKMGAAATPSRPAPQPTRGMGDPSVIGSPAWQAEQARKAQGGGGKVIVTAPNLGAAGSVAKSYSSRNPGASSKSGGGSGGAAAASASSGGTYNDGYNKAVAEANARKSSDAPQVAALQQMIDTGFASARDTKLGNLDLVLTQQDKIMLDDYLKRAAGLEGSRADNEKSEADGSFANIANRARERGDILMQATSQGAGESDTLRSTLQALRNWSANQSDVNRSYFDTLRSVNTAITDLNTDTRTARTNLHTSANSDRESVWTNYYNQQADAYTQIGNIKANPNSDSYQAGADSFAKAASTAATAWTSPGIPDAVKNWEGTVKAEDRGLNNTDIGAASTNIGTPKKPEGATLRKW